MLRRSHFISGLAALGCTLVQAQTAAPEPAPATVAHTAVDVGAVADAAADAAASGIAAAGVAQPAAPAAAAPLPSGPRFAVRGYTIGGNTLLAPELLQQAVEPYTGPDSDFQTIQSALEALEKVIEAFGPGLTLQQRAITALRQALEEKQEPVAWMYVNYDGECEQIEYGPVFDDPSVTPLYTAPPKKEWVGLTTGEMKEIADRYHLKPPNIPIAFRAIEAKLKEKNHG